MEENEQAFLKAFEEHADALFRHALFRLNDREKAYDLTQDAYMKTWDYICNGGTVTHFKSFLYRTLRNLIIDEYRRKHTRSLDELLEDEAVAPAVEAQMAEGSREEVESSLDEERLVSAVHERIAELPDHYREVLMLRFVDGLSTGEIAETVGVTENVVSVRIHRGIAKLKQLCNI